MSLSSVPFAHFTFTPSLRKLMTFIISLSSFPCNIPYMTLVLMTFHITDGLLDMYLKNPEELFTICVELCPFFPKCLTLPNTKILPLAYKDCITLHYAGAESHILRCLTLHTYIIKILNPGLRLLPTEMKQRLIQCSATLANLEGFENLIPTLWNKGIKAECYLT